MLEQEKTLYSENGRFIFRNKKITREQFLMINDARLMGMNDEALKKEFGNTIAIDRKSGLPHAFLVRIEGENRRALMCMDTSELYNPAFPRPSQQSRVSGPRQNQEVRYSATLSGNIQPCVLFKDQVNSPLEKVSNSIEEEKEDTPIETASILFDKLKNMNSTDGKNKENSCDSEETNIQLENNSCDSEETKIQVENEVIFDTLSPEQLRANELFAKRHHRELIQEIHPREYFSSSFDQTQPIGDSRILIFLCSFTLFSMVASVVYSFIAKNIRSMHETVFPNDCSNDFDDDWGNGFDDDWG